MKTNDPTSGEALANKMQSKIDQSGTDPNRYGGYYAQQDAERISRTRGNDQCSSLIPGLNANVGTIERILMVAAGTYLLFDALMSSKRKVIQTAAAGGMLARGISGYCPMYDFTGAEGGRFKSSNVNIRTRMVIDKPVSAVYDFWRRLENLPIFMKHLESVREIDNLTSEWKATGPGGIGSLSWKAQILMDEKDKVLSWHSLPESTINNAGKVYFKDLGDRTELDVTISYHAPLGVAGEAIAKWLNPMFERLVRNDIESFKNHIENDPTTY